MRVAVILGFVVLFAACGSAAGDRCDAEPVGSVNAFFVGENASRDVVATVAFIAPLEGLAGFRYDMRDGALLTWIAKEPMANVLAEGTYRFVVDYRGGWPDASSILVFEGDQLIFAAVTDRETDIPGLTINVGDASCSSRGRTKCHESLVNVPVIVGGKTIYNGESATVGEFEVRVLTAQKVKYSSRCADAGVPTLSFTVARRR
mgnify:CR=1 FL=1